MGAVICLTASPTYAANYEVIDGTEVVWQAPSNPKGVLFVAHGCQHGAVDFWPKSGACPKCIGLPVEMAITRTVLERGYVLLAVSSMDRDRHRCWDISLTPQFTGDIQKVDHVLSVLLPRHRWETLPLYLMGASSGGAFALALAGHIRAAAVCSQIMAIPQHYFKMLLNTSSTLLGRPLPPTMFVHMPRDTRTHELVAEDMELLEAVSVPTMEIGVDPLKITPTFFSDRAHPEINQEQSHAIYSALKTNTMLDTEGFLIHDPRSSHWRQALVQARVPGLEGLRMQPDASALSELLNLAWAGHEIVSDTTSRMLDWFETVKLEPGGAKVISGAKGELARVFEASAS